MIICNRCGGPNDDAELLCQVCGRKLQSGLSERRNEQGQDQEPLRPMQVQPLFPGLRRFLVKGLEAWVYVLVISAVGIFAAFSGRWLYLLPVLLLTALLAWSRKL